MVEGFRLLVLRMSRCWLELDDRSIVSVCCRDIQNCSNYFFEEDGFGCSLQKEWFVHRVAAAVDAVLVVVVVAVVVVAAAAVVVAAAAVDSVLVVAVLVDLAVLSSKFSISQKGLPTLAVSPLVFFPVLVISSQCLYRGLVFDEDCVVVRYLLAS